MSDLEDLYQEVIIDHSRKPRNFRPLVAPDRKADGYNPLCGDKVTIYLKLSGGVIQDISFEGNGCAISTSSASILTEAVKGKTEKEAQALFQAFHALLTDQPAPGTDLGKLKAFGGVSQFPARVKCATLAWHTFHAALESKVTPVSTEDPS